MSGMWNEALSAGGVVGEVAGGVGWLQEAMQRRLPAEIVMNKWKMLVNLNLSNTATDFL